jgi:hypothetical protein
MDKKSQESSYQGRLDYVKFILKVCIVIGMLIAAVGISIFTYVLAYPESNVVLIPQSKIRLLHVSTWLIISGLITVFVFGTASQIASYMKRRSKETAISYRSKKESGMGTGYNAIASSPKTVDETTVWARSPIGLPQETPSDNEESVALLAGVEPPAVFPKTKSLRINFSATPGKPDDQTNLSSPV